MDFEIVGPISEIEIIAIGGRIRNLTRLKRIYGFGRWRKLKGLAFVRFRETGETFRAEVHWYEASGIGRKEFKIKRRLA
jgi:hypothetical protein